jgi:hypothetical protein
LYDEDKLVDDWACFPEMIVATDAFQHARDEWNGILNLPMEFSTEKGG